VLNQFSYTLGCILHITGVILTELPRAPGALSAKGRRKQQLAFQGYGHTNKRVLSDKNENILQKQRAV